MTRHERSNQAHLQHEAALLRTAVTPLHRHQIELDGFEITEEELERRDSLQSCDRLEVPAAAGASLHPQGLPSVLGYQGPQPFVLPLAAINAVQPLDLPRSGAARAPEPATAIESAALGKNRPGRADRTIAVGPGS